MRPKPTGIFRVTDLPPKLDPEQLFSLKVQLHKDQAFGKNNPYKLYSIKSVVSNIAVILWKSGLLNSVDSINLAKALSNGPAIVASLNKLRRTDFSALQLLPLDYNIYDLSEVESTVNNLKKELRDACLLHYDMDLSAVQPYCGGQWTGAPPHRSDLTSNVPYPPR